MRLSLLPLLSISSLGLARHSRRATFYHGEQASRRGLLDLDLDVSASIDLFGSNHAEGNPVPTDTGKTVYYDVVVSEGVAKPDGGKDR